MTHYTHTTIRIGVIFLLWVSCFHALAQDEILVSGSVHDQTTGESLPGATVKIVGSTQGTSTDYDGNFQLNAPPQATISVSFIGYRTQEIALQGRQQITVPLSPDAALLSDVVVIGYGSVEKKDVTGVLAKVGTEDFNKGVINAPDQLMEGKVAGLQITPDAQPGGSTTIRLRGISINGESPLIVVDGVPLDGNSEGVKGGRNPLNFINPADIADITILKDASASAIYGARGANGVIIITTKSGNTKKPRISYDGYVSASLTTRMPDVFTPSQFRAVIADKQPQKVNELGDANTDWLKEITRVAVSTQHNLSVSGKARNTAYFVSFNYLQNKGIIRNTQSDKYNGSIKLNQSFLGDALSVTLNSKVGYTKDILGPDPNVLGAAASFDPTRPVKDTARATSRGGYFQWGSTLATANPVASQQFLDKVGKTTRVLSNVELEYKIPFLDGLTAKANLGYDHNQGNYDGYELPEAKESQTNGGSALIQEETRTSQLYEYYINYKKQFHIHAVDVTVGYAWQNFETQLNETAGDSIKREGGTGAWQPTYNVQTRDLPVENRLISFFGRANYELKNRYLLTVSLRRDGSSRFSPNNRWGIFPAFAVGWRILDESFAQPLTQIFSELKFRASYGVTGNQEIDDYIYSTYYTSSEVYGDNASYQFGDNYVYTLRPKGVDPNIKWEETVMFNAGIDASFWSGRLTLSTDYYIKNVRDLLFDTAIPAGSSVSDRVTTNIGEIQNTGVELTVAGVVVDQPDLTWNMNVNAAYNKNEVIKLDNRTGVSLADFQGYESGSISGDVGQTIQRRKVGVPVDAFFVYQHKRQDGRLVTDPNVDGIQDDLEMYVDVNGDNKINEKDRMIYKKPNPDVIVGLTSNVSYKQFDLSLSMKGSFGHHIYNNVASANGYFNQLTRAQVLNNIHTSAYTTRFQDKQLFSDYYVQPASFFKLNNISLGYSLKPSKVGNLRVYCTAQNVFILTSYKGVSPEISDGIDNNLYPRALTLLLGLSLTY